MKNFESIGKGMPYIMPEHFMEDVTERIIARAACPKVIRRSLYYAFAAAASIAAMALILLSPSGTSTFNVPNYENISECMSIDEVFESMSTDDLGLFSMMSNYYEK
jgi:hypothetical protein